MHTETKQAIKTISPFPFSRPIHFLHTVILIKWSVAVFVLFKVFHMNQIAQQPCPSLERPVETLVLMKIHSDIKTVNFVPAGVKHKPCFKLIPLVACWLTHSDTAENGLKLTIKWSCALLWDLNLCWLPRLDLCGLCTEWVACRVLSLHTNTQGFEWVVLPGLLELPGPSRLPHILRQMGPDK